MTAYSDARRAEVTALALSYGPGGDKRAGRETDIPSRTIRRWVALVRAGDERGEAIVSAETREAVADRFWSVVQRGTERMADALADPRTPARDVARIVEVAATQNALLSGGVTARTESKVESGAAGEPGDSLQWWEQALGGELSWEERWLLRETIDGVWEWAQVALVTEMRAARAEGRDPRLIFPRARLLHISRLAEAPPRELLADGVPILLAEGPTDV